MSEPTNPTEPASTSGWGAPPPPPPGGAYGAPPPGFQGSGPGYGSAPPGQPGQLSQQDERMWAMLAHLGGIVLWFIAPLLVMLIQGEKSVFVRRQAVEALNFQITLTIAYLVGMLLMLVFIGIFIIMAAAVGGLIFMIVAGVQANSGQDYRYPINLRLVN